MKELKQLARDAYKLGLIYICIDADGDVFGTDCPTPKFGDYCWDSHNSDKPYEWIYLGEIDGEWNEYNSKFKVDDLLQDKGCNESESIMSVHNVKKFTYWNQSELTNSTSLNDNVQHTPSINAISTLEETIKTIGERGQHYDSGEERSIPKVVSLFNELTDKELTIKDGYRFMMLLKLVRSTQGQDKIDNYIDLAGYSALCSEVYNED